MRRAVGHLPCRSPSGRDACSRQRQQQRQQQQQRAHTQRQSDIAGEQRRRTSNTHGPVVHAERRPGAGEDEGVRRALPPDIARVGRADGSVAAAAALRPADARVERRDDGGLCVAPGHTPLCPSARPAIAVATEHGPDAHPDALAAVRKRRAVPLPSAESRGAAANPGTRARRRRPRGLLLRRHHPRRAASEPCSPAVPGAFALAVLRLRQHAGAAARFALPDPLLPSQPDTAFCPPESDGDSNARTSSPPPSPPSTPPPPTTTTAATGTTAAALASSAIPPQPDIPAQHPPPPTALAIPPPLAPQQLPRLPATTESLPRPPRLHRFQRDRHAGATSPQYREHHGIPSHIQHQPVFPPSRAADERVSESLGRAGQESVRQSQDQSPAAHALAGVQTRQSAAAAAAAAAGGGGSGGGSGLRERTQLLAISAATIQRGGVCASGKRGRRWVRAAITSAASGQRGLGAVGGPEFAGVASVTAGTGVRHAVTHRHAGQRATSLGDAFTAGVDPAPGAKDGHEPLARPRRPLRSRRSLCRARQSSTRTSATCPRQRRRAAARTVRHGGRDVGSEAPRVQRPFGRTACEAGEAGEEVRSAADLGAAASEEPAIQSERARACTDGWAGGDGPAVWPPTQRSAAAATPTTTAAAAAAPAPRSTSPPAADERARVTDSNGPHAARRRPADRRRPPARPPDLRGALRRLGEDDPVERADPRTAPPGAGLAVPAPDRSGRHPARRHGPGTYRDRSQDREDPAERHGGEAEHADHESRGPGSGLGGGECEV